MDHLDLWVAYCQPPTVGSLTASFSIDLPLQRMRLSMRSALGDTKFIIRSMDSLSPFYSCFEIEVNKITTPGVRAAVK